MNTFEGEAWLAIAPFYMRGIRPRFCPPVPGINNFLELDVRTYVYDEQSCPGVWFDSLDCNQSLAVWTARTFLYLPYQHARMRASTQVLTPLPKPPITAAVAHRAALTPLHGLLISQAAKICSKSTHRSRSLGR
jgi:hypothetical protein